MTTPSERAGLEPGAPAPAGGIGLSEPFLTGQEWAYIKECLDTGWVSSVGSFVNRFETEFAARVGARHAVAMGSGTAALHIALLASGVAPGDEVILPSCTFIAPANAVRYVGAWPVFVDIEPDYWQVDPAQVAAFLEDDCEHKNAALVNRHTGRRVSAIMPVDILGHPADLDAIQRLADAHGLRVIEDATESLGARYRERRLGEVSPVSCFSFNGNKLITTGSGGMLVTDDTLLANRARYLATQAKDDALEYVHHEVGYNYRLSNLLAAMGCAQLEQIDTFVARKRAIAARYTAAFANVPGLAPMREAPWAFAAYWMFTMRIDAARYGMDSRSLMRSLAAQRIQSRPLWQPLHQSIAHGGSWSRACPVAGELHAEALSLPCSVGLAETDQDRVIAMVRSAKA